MASDAFLWGLSTAVVLALISGVVSLWIHFKDGSFHEVRSAVRQLDLDLHELYDQVEKWTRRDRVRRFRQGQEEAAQPQLPQRGTPEYKHFLRQRANGVRGN